MMFKSLTIFFFLVCSLTHCQSGSADNEIPFANGIRDLAADVRVAQEKLAVFIQQSLQFSSTYQIITNADVKIEVFNLFHQIYQQMAQLQISQATINQIRILAEQDIVWLDSADLNMLDANNLILATAYQINQNMRNNSLDLVPALYEKFVNDDTTYFNVRYNGYLGTLTITGNTVELAILAAIEGMEGPEVANIYALLQRSNDIINFDAENMTKELIFFNHDFFEASNAIYTVVEQISTQQKSN